MKFIHWHTRIALKKHHTRATTITLMKRDLSLYLFISIQCVFEDWLPCLSSVYMLCVDSVAVGAGDPVHRGAFQLWAESTLRVAMAAAVQPRCLIRLGAYLVSWRRLRASRQNGEFVSDPGHTSLSSLTRMAPPRPWTFVHTASICRASLAQ